MNDKHVVILAGGKGSRLKPYTVSMPKPLVPLGDKPILEIVIEKLKSHGFTRVTLTVNHMADIIVAFFGDGSKWGVNIDYTLEDKPLSTMGPLSLVKDLPENFLVMNGDVLTDLNYGDFYDEHVKSKSIFTIGSSRRVDTIDYGVLHCDNEKKLMNFEEKPKSNFLVSMGVYVVNKKVLEFIPKNTFFGFDHLMHVLLDNKIPVEVYEYPGYWLDIGRPKDYELAIEKVKEIDFFK